MVAQGQVKAGRGTLIGNAGEYYVVAELLKRGIIASLTPRNAPSFDVLATRGDLTVRLRVKTKSAHYRDWQWMAKADGCIFRDICPDSDFTVLVNLAEKRADLDFYILPTPVIDEWLRTDFAQWAALPGRNGHVRDATSRKRNLPYPRFEARLVTYREAWETLWQPRGPAA